MRRAKGINRMGAMLHLRGVEMNWAWFVFGVANLVGAVLVYFLL